MVARTRLLRPGAGGLASRGSRHSPQFATQLGDLGVVKPQRGKPVANLIAQAVNVASVEVPVKSRAGLRYRP